MSESLKISFIAQCSSFVKIKNCLAVDRNFSGKIMCSKAYMLAFVIQLIKKFPAASIYTVDNENQT